MMGHHCCQDIVLAKWLLCDARPTSTALVGQEISMKEGSCILRLWAPAFFLVFICYISTWEWLRVIQVKENKRSARAQKHPEGIEDVFLLPVHPVTIASALLTEDNL